MIVQLPIPTTLVTEEGEIYGYLDSEGIPQAVAHSNVGREVMVWDDVLKMKVPRLVVWDGAAPPAGRCGKGELTSHPVELQRIHRELGGPRYKMNASWGPRLVEKAAAFDEANPEQEA